MRGARSSPLALLAALALVGGAGACNLAGDALPEGVAPSAEETRPLAVAARIPEVELRDVEGRAVMLSGVVAEGPIALVFYRGGW